MSKTTLTFTDAQLDRIDADLLMEVLRPTLGTALCPGEHDGSGAADWRDAAGQSWTIRTYIRSIGGRWIAWTATEEAGVDDVAILDCLDGDEEDEAAQSYADEIAAGLDC